MASRSPATASCRRSGSAGLARTSGKSAKVRIRPAWSRSRSASAFSLETTSSTAATRRTKTPQCGCAGTSRRPARSFRFQLRSRTGKPACPCRPPRCRSPAQATGSAPRIRLPTRSPGPPRKVERWVERWVATLVARLRRLPAVAELRLRHRSRGIPRVEARVARRRSAQQLGRGSQSPSVPRRHGEGHGEGHATSDTHGETELHSVNPSKNSHTTSSLLASNGALPLNRGPSAATCPTPESGKVGRASSRARRTLIPRSGRNVARGPC